ncbi:DUF397 domain-containing protein [Streptomyces sp. NRRL S-495]|uniref:DUF397 domain-containing protein n=1 Tax=Streptomyces sp. NRRL S-495 TaxID=1609133 RepID=UPI0005F94312|nr:DUF397 domain-containing protein [Streptomyces sp. NRRL S-495]KJY26757.1 hypothetical protein VR45_36300 [Streptomyces sp. NRRL S-495]
MTPRFDDLSRASWFKSTHSDNGGTCVEVTADFRGVVPVRDSKDPVGLAFPTDAWRSFVAAVQAGEFGTV